MLIDAGNKSDGEYIVEFLKEKKLNNIDYFIITHGDMDHRGGAEIILNNCNVGQIFMPEGINDFMNLVISKYQFEDIEKEIKCEKIDILKVGHHGSDSSTSTEFLNRIKPTYAIISAGDNKKYKPNIGETS